LYYKSKQHDNYTNTNRKLNSSAITQTQIENLTAAQLKSFNSLVRLGDSKELALKTVLEMQVNTDSQIYQLAYYS